VQRDEEEEAEKKIETTKRVRESVFQSKMELLAGSSVTLSRDSGSTAPLTHINLFPECEEATTRTIHGSNAVLGPTSLGLGSHELQKSRPWYETTSEKLESSRHEEGLCALKKSAVSRVDPLHRIQKEKESNAVNRQRSVPLRMSNKARKHWLSQSNHSRNRQKGNLSPDTSKRNSSESLRGSSPAIDLMALRQQMQQREEEERHRIRDSFRYSS
jgi:hypothetical protein